MILSKNFVFHVDAHVGKSGAKRAALLFTNLVETSIWTVKGKFKLSSALGISDPNYLSLPEFSQHKAVRSIATPPHGWVLGHPRYPHFVHGTLTVN